MTEQRADYQLPPEPDEPFVFQPEESTSNVVVKVAKRLIETHLKQKIVVLSRIATQRIDWASPFFWLAMDVQGKSHVFAMRYNNTTNRWGVEFGIDQQWSFPESIEQEYGTRPQIVRKERQSDG